MSGSDDEMDKAEKKAIKEAKPDDLNSPYFTKCEKWDLHAFQVLQTCSSDRLPSSLFYGKWVAKLTRHQGLNTVCLTPNNYNPDGRRFGKSINAMSLPGFARRLLFHKNYIDLDLRLCFPTLALHLCDEYKLPAPLLRQFVNDREGKLRMISESYGITVKHAKKCLLKPLHHGSIYHGEGKVESPTVKGPGHKFAEGFQEEVYKNMEIVVNKAKYAEIRSRAQEKCNRDKAQGKYANPIGTATGYILQTYEWKTIKHAHNYLKKQRLRPDIYTFDGLMIRKDKHLEEYWDAEPRRYTRLLDELNKYVRRKMRIERLTFVEKPLTPSKEDYVTVYQQQKCTSQKGVWTYLRNIMIGEAFEHGYMRMGGAVMASSKRKPWVLKTVYRTPAEFYHSIQTKYENTDLYQFANKQVTDWLVDGHHDLFPKMQSSHFDRSLIGYKNGVVKFQAPYNGTKLPYDSDDDEEEESGDESDHMSSDGEDEIHDKKTQDNKKDTRSPMEVNGGAGVSVESDVCEVNNPPLFPRSGKRFDENIPGGSKEEQIETEKKLRANSNVPPYPNVCFPKTKCSWKLFNTARTPIMDQICHYQWGHKERDPGRLTMQETIEVMFARGLFKVRQFDNFEVALFLQGAAGCGKTTLMDAYKSIFRPGEVGIISSNHEKVFGLDSLQDKSIVYLSEVQKEIGKSINVEQLRSMISGESVSVPRKNKSALTLAQWLAQVFLAGEQRIMAKTGKGGLARRLIIVLFERIVSAKVQDQHLLSKLIQEMPAVIARGLQLYSWVLKSGKHIWNLVPLECVERKQSHMDDGSHLARFLSSRFCIKAPGCKLELDVFRKAFDGWQKDPEEGNCKYSGSVCRDSPEFIQKGYTIKRLERCKVCGPNMPLRKCIHGTENRAKIHIIEGMKCEYGCFDTQSSEDMHKNFERRAKKIRRDEVESTGRVVLDHRGGLVKK